MASGKSLELAQIKPQADHACTCGAPYSTHLRKDGKGILKKFDNPGHGIKQFVGYNRDQRRKMMRSR